MDYPPLLSAKHIMHIFSCSRSKAREIMCEPHRPVWIPSGGRKPTEILRIHRDLFFKQLEEESNKNKMA